MNPKDTKAEGAPDPGSRVWIHTLGCPKNEVDSEMMAGRLMQQGMQIVTDLDDADLLLINTCAFIDEAKEESVEAILEAGLAKGNRKLLVTGCLAERYGDELLREVPEIDGLVGVRSMESVPGVARDLMRGSPVCDRETKWETAVHDSMAEDRITIGTAHTAYIKIAEGCDRPCAFCSIPSFRGKLSSRTLESIDREAHGLAVRGAREVVLIGQETTAYGNDFSRGAGQKNGYEFLPDLFDRLAKIEEIRWVRLMYAYPSGVTDELISRLGKANACSYIDMPVQHISTSVLRLMRRGISGDGVRNTIDRLRAGVSGLTLRSTILVGFPGETDDDFQQLVKFVGETEFDHLGVFSFSPQENTAAWALEDRVPQDVVRERQQEILDLQASIMEHKTKGRIGSQMRVLVDETEEGNTLCRSEGDAPEVDGVVILPGIHGKPGDFLEVEIVDGHEATLWGRPVGGGEER